MVNAEKAHEVEPQIEVYPDAELEDAPGAHRVGAASQQALSAFSTNNKKAAAVGVPVFAVFGLGLLIVVVLVAAAMTKAMRRVDAKQKTALSETFDVEGGDAALCE